MGMIYVSPMGDVNDDLLNMICRFVEGMFGLKTERYTTLPYPYLAFDQRRMQYSSTAILKHLGPICPADGTRLLAITGVDLFIPMLTFVYGQAQLNGKACVVSFSRLTQQFYGLPEDRELTITRIRKEVAHEMGHTFGLVHCRERSCLMSLSTEIAQVDFKSEDFCGTCWIELQDNLNALKKEKMKSRILELHR